MGARALVLASGSAARLRLLRDAGFDPLVVVSGVDEDGHADEDTRSQVAALAREKAEAVADPAGDAVVVACDSMLEFDGRHLRASRARRTRPAPGWWPCGGARAPCSPATASSTRPTGRRACGVAGTEVRFARTTDAELDAYLATGEALDVAGAFTIDGRSAPFIEGVVGDPSNVIGLSLPLFRNLLATLGIAIADLWAPPRPAEARS